jgi:RNA methyltransferase, TrmH family
LSKRPNSENSFSAESSALTIRSTKVSNALELLNKRDRELRSEFLVEGAHGVEEVIAANLAKQIFVTKEFALANNVLMSKAANARISIFETDPIAIEKLSETLSPQGIVAVAAYVAKDLEKEDLSTANFVVVLSNVREPGNAGSIIRVADAAGADLVIFAGTCVDPHNGKVVRSSAGSIFNVKVRQADDVAETLRALTQTNHNIYIADGNAQMSWSDIDLKNPVAWVLGNEAWGVSNEDAPVGQRVAIPIYGKAESLNVATAAALCLYETAKSRAGN